MPKVSIIVPVYNTEKDLPRCIDSILAQTYTDFELILVNDGSTDFSGKICDEYATKDNRIVVIHKENGGVSSARNIGIKNSTGEWISFVDSDDYLMQFFLQNFAMDENNDMEICGIEVVGGDNYIHCINDVKKQYVGSSIRDLCLTIFNHRYITSPCAKIIKKSFILEHKILFDTKITIAEDTLFILNCMLYSNSIMIYGYVGYCYVHPLDITRKYNITVLQLKYNLVEMNNVAINLSEKFAFSNKILTNRINEFQYSIFQQTLRTISDQEKIKQLTLYRQLKLYKYRFRMTLKERVFHVLSYAFPKWFYLHIKNE